MKIQYIFDKKFNQSSLEIIDKANEIITDYERQGFDLTLRQLYYQFVARDIIPNNQSEYKRIGNVVNDARLMGMIDWDSITDRTRNLHENSFWSNPQSILMASADCYNRDKWRNQKTRIEVWVEKDALRGIVADICERLETPHFSCRGYVSQSEMWSASQRILRAYEAREQETVIIHLGDHDPSGIDMSRDIEERIELFLGKDYDYPSNFFKVERIALNMDQVENYNPPPNPAKLTDTRCTKYINKFGNESWELDALEPIVLSHLIEENILKYRDLEKWEEIEEQQEEEKATLKRIITNYDKIYDFLKTI